MQPTDEQMRKLEQAAKELVAWAQEVCRQGLLPPNPKSAMRVNTETNKANSDKQDQ